MVGSGYNLKIELDKFAGRLYVGCEKRRGSSWFQDSWLLLGQGGIPFPKLEEKKREEKRRREEERIFWVVQRAENSRSSIWVGMEWFEMHIRHSSVKQMIRAKCHLSFPAI